MRRYMQTLGKKVFLFVTSVVLLSVLVFYISRLAPGEPLVSYYGDRVEKMSPQERDWVWMRPFMSSIYAGCRMPFRGTLAFLINIRWM